MTADEIQARLLGLADPDTARSMRRFFKTGPGQYGDGDQMLGIKVPKLREVVREFRGVPIAEAEMLLQSPMHECRAVALLLLVWAFEQGEHPIQKGIYQLYMRNTHRINNWDLVDASAREIVGGYLWQRSRRPLYRLARSRSLWERRIAVVATYHFLRRGDFGDTFGIARLLLDDKEDLIHKAVGWMLREVGKRDQKAAEEFLVQNYRGMPRTMLRYAIERLPERRRQQYLQGQISDS
jgi:3-methyladenine DNA glycosylase AlkD